MMRRVLCLALSIMMLCGTAMAEASKVTVTWDADVEGAKAYWAAVSDDEGAVLDGMAKALVELMEGLEVQWITQESGMYMALSLKDTLLLDMGIESDWDYSRIFSNLWPDHYLSAVLTQDAVEQSRQSWEKLSTISLEQLAVDMAHAVDLWLADLPVTEEQGNFTGDAYEGAVQQYSYTFDDQAVCQLVECLIVVLEQHDITDELLESYLGEDANVYESIRQKNREVADTNRFSYVLQLACGPAGEYMGATLLVMENGQQVMTLSHGAGDNGWQLVWGYGFNGMNYYFDLEVFAQQDTQETEVGLFVFCDPQRLGFRNIHQTNEYLLQVATAYFCPQQDGQWATVAEVLLMSQQMDCYVVEGIRNEAEGNAEYAIHWYSGEMMETPLQTIHVNVAPCEPMTWDVGSMTPIDTETDGSDELLTQLVEESAQELLLKLFKLVPTQLLTMLIM